MALSGRPCPSEGSSAKLTARRLCRFWSRSKSRQGLPPIMAGVNLCIMLALSMVVLAGLIGAGGLGGEVTRGMTRMMLGLGIRAGVAIVVLAVIFDRTTQGAVHCLSKAADSS